MTMPTETRKALRSSISKWRRWAAGKMRRDEAPGVSSCPLCGLFIKRLCIGCPVRERTGLPACEGTPYCVAAAQWARSSRHCPEFKSAAAKEVEFLESLLPKVGSSMPGRKPLTRKATRR
jgi:hypothetical protein